jgi:3-deoxy-D-manno-octulosonic-acid transferase
MLRVYSAISYALHPLLIVWLKRRVKRGKEDAARLRERFGRVSMNPVKGKLVWMHAASVGEANSIQPLIERLHAAHPDLHLLITTGTVSSAKIMMQRLPERAVHLYAPVDTRLSVRRFLKRVKPDLAIWVESEFWPNLLHETHKRGVPMLLVNARMSQASFDRWKKAAPLLRMMLGWFDGIYAGSALDMQRLQALGVNKVEHCGNLKYDTRALPYDAGDMSGLLEKIGDRRIWLASSTHPGEEEIIAQVHAQIRETYPELLTIIVPRHPQRGDDICSMLRSRKLTVSQRSKKQILIPESDVYVADTLGELGMFYRLAGVVFIGGTMVPRGGHNPIEPGQLDCAIIAGPHMENFATICREMQAAEAIRRVSDADTLAQAVLEKLRDHDAQEDMARKAHAFVDSKRGTAEVLHRKVAQLLSLPLAEKEDAGDAA